MLDPASSVEMVKVLEEDPMVGGVGGDVQVSTTIFRLIEVFQQLFALQQISLPEIALNIINVYILYVDKKYMIPLQTLLSYLNLFVHWMETLILGCEHCMVLKSIGSKQIIFYTLYVERGALAFSGLLWHLWVSGYSCLLQGTKEKL